MQYTGTMSVTKTQIQIRIDKQTKKEATQILDRMGLDTSTAVRMFLKQLVNTGRLPLEIRDINGFGPGMAKELRRSIKDVDKTSKTFSSAKGLLKDLSS